MIRILLRSLLYVLIPFSLCWSTIINIPSDYPTIQAGIVNSNDGDTVLVQPGLYYEIIDYYGHNVIVGSLFSTTGDTSYISATIIDGVGSGPVITLQSGEDNTAALIGFTIQNGYKDNGGGIRCINGSSPVISNNLIVNNTGYRNCGGIYCLNGSNPLIKENIISANNGNNKGGGIFSFGSSPLIVNNTIRENTADIGGGIFIGDSSFAVIEDNIIISNSTGGLEGGGIGAEGAYLRIKGNVISGNYARWEGGGISARTSDLVITGCQVDSNTSGSDGGGISVWRSDLTIRNTVIAGNTAEDFLGGGIFTYESIPVIYNSIFYQNTSTGEGGGAYFSHSGVEIINSIFLLNEATWGNDQVGGNIDSIKISYSNIQGGWPGVGNIDIDPLFRDTTNGGFHLMSIACGDSADSPCIDTGDPDIPDSLLDCSWGLGGSRSDMGAYGGGESTTVGILDNLPQLPKQIILLQNYPNPFNAQT